VCVWHESGRKLKGLWRKNSHTFSSQNGFFFVIAYKYALKNTTPLVLFFYSLSKMKYSVHTTKAKFNLIVSCILKLYTVYRCMCRKLEIRETTPSRACFMYVLFMKKSGTFSLVRKIFYEYTTHIISCNRRSLQKLIKKMYRDVCYLFEHLYT